MTWTLDAGTPTLDAGADVATLDGVLLGGGTPASVFQWIPSYGSDSESTVPLREAKFGDGYTQRTGLGINNIADKWNLTFSNRSGATKDAIIAFLRARANGTSFSWTPYDSAESVRVYCKQWSIVAVDHDIFSITCTFERAYGE